jgi:PAS domain S-box-containing protein
MQANLKLKAKITLWIEILVVILVIITGGITTMREKISLESELRKRGFALSADLAEFVISPLLSQDIATLRRYINHSMSQEYVRHAYLLNDTGIVIMHNDLDEVGKTYTDQVNRAAVHSNSPGCVHVPHPDGAYFDIYTPIFLSDARLGTIRLGYSLSAIDKEIADARRQIFLIGIVTTIAGGVMAYFLASFVSSPIKKITDATQKVANGDLITKLTIDRKDEIGVLATSFNKMTEDLRKTTISKNYVDSIIGSMNDTLVVVNPDAKIRSVNKATCDLLRYREKELVGQQFSLIVSEGDTLFSSSGFMTLLGGEAIVNREVSYIKKSGERIPVLFSASILKNKEGDVLGAVGIARDISERIQSEKALQQSERKLRFLSYRLLTAQEEERRRLSIELHDELGQSLMVLIQKVRAIQRNLVREQDGLNRACEETIGYINEITENVRRLSRNLSPYLLEGLGLSAAIRRLVETSTKHNNIKISLDMQELQGLFSKGTQIGIYRILQECFTNISKHANATNVSVDIEKQDECALFRVEDNGRGFCVYGALGKDPNEKGFGLTTMYERSRMMGGTIDIWSQKKVGTNITFTVPFDGEGVRS